MKLLFKRATIAVLLAAALYCIASTGCTPAHSTCQNDRFVGQGHDHWKDNLPKASKRRVANY